MLSCFKSFNSCLDVIVNKLKTLNCNIITNCTVLNVVKVNNLNYHKYPGYKFDNATPTLNITVNNTNITIYITKVDKSFIKFGIYIPPIVSRSANIA